MFWNGKLKVSRKTIKLLIDMCWCGDWFFILEYYFWFMKTRAPIVYELFVMEKRMQIYAVSTFYKLFTANGWMLDLRAVSLCKMGSLPASTLIVLQQTLQIAMKLYGNLMCEHAS